MNTHEYRKKIEEEIEAAHEARLGRLARLEGAAGPSTKSITHGADFPMADMLEDAPALDAGGASDPQSLQDRERALVQQALDDRGAPEEQRIEALRVGAASIGEDDGALGSLFRIVASADEPVRVRAEALNLLRKLRFTSNALRRRRPELLEALRAAATDGDPELRLEALEMLAQEKDEETQRLLQKGLWREDQALVPAADAIRLLGYDAHALDFSLLQDIVRSSDDVEAREEAVRRLSADPASGDLLAGVFRDRGEDERLRRASGASLQVVAPMEFEQAAQEIALDESEDESVRATCIAALGRFGNPASLLDGGELDRRLQRLADDAPAGEVREAARTYRSLRIRGG